MNLYSWWCTLGLVKTLHLSCLCDVVISHETLGHILIPYAPWKNGNSDSFGQDVEVLQSQVAL
jgi:hypothetical protein